MASRLMTGLGTDSTISAPLVGRRTKPPGVSTSAGGSSTRGGTHGLLPDSRLDLRACPDALLPGDDHQLVRFEAIQDHPHPIVRGAELHRAVHHHVIDPIRVFCTLLLLVLDDEQEFTPL